MIKNRMEKYAILGIVLCKKIISIFLGPFLTAYFIKQSMDSLTLISVYNIFSYVILGIGSYTVASIVKNKFKLGMLRLGIIVNFIYIIVIVVLKEKIIEHLWLIGILNGIAQSTYYMPINILNATKIEIYERKGYEVLRKTLESIISIVFPIILGSVITITNYTLTANIILVVSIVQIILSLLVKPVEETSNKLTVNKIFKKYKKYENIRQIFLAEFLIGFNISGGALDVLMTVLIFNAFKTDVNLGIITSVSSILGIFIVYWYSKTNKKNERRIILVSSIVPVITALIMIFYSNNVTVIIYNFTYIVFVGLLQLVRDVKITNISKGTVMKDNEQSEFWAVRELFLNFGRIASFVLLLVLALINNVVMLNVLLIILTLTIPVMGNLLRKVEDQ